MKSALQINSGARIGYPDFSIEDQFEGTVCGLDEVGRGPLAGPVVAACVVISKNQRHHDFVSDIRDSKKLSDKKLDYLFHKITDHFSYAIAEISPQEIDEINILQASLKAMKLAHEKLNGIDHALVDGNKAPKLSCPVTTVVKGDSKSVSIAAASIIAKVYRDRIMTKLALGHPHYGWETNAGYPSPVHLVALEKYGITPYHRRSYAPVRRIIESA
jgi:ribonuclease HII